MNIAVIMSLYYGERPEKFLRAISSVVNQLIDPDVKVRIYLGIDGPLPSELSQVVYSKKQNFYKIISFPQNRGLVYVLNDLIKNLEDEAFIFRMDTDDFSYPKRFSKQISYLNQHPEIDILGSSIVEVGEKNENKRIVHFAKNHIDAIKRLPRGVPVAHPTVCFRANVFQKVGGYPEVRNNEDIAMWFKCFKYGLKFDNVREPLYEFSIDGNFWGRRGLKKAWSELLVYLRGIWYLNPITIDYMFPVARFLLRLAPKSLQKLAYRSFLRDIEKLKIKN